MTDTQSKKPRARVFISCGQSKITDEPKIAAGIKDKLSELGFDPYVAVAEQTLKGLKDNLFDRLRDSEYLVFIDFKRERLGGSDLHRGSLFSHQELAIAAFLDIELLALQEEGVNRLDGMLSALQANPISFSERDKVPELVAEEVNRRILQSKWDPAWRNELVLVRETDYFSEACRIPELVTGRFFHIGVQNRHRRNVATNCYAYLDKAKNLDSGAELPLKTVEFKWEGYNQPNAHILAKTIRKFDAFWIRHNQPSALQFNSFCDATYFLPGISTPGRYELTYLVLADNFPPARRSFTLTLDGELAKTSFDQM